jgi:putative ABC transport system permease protein
MSKTSRRMSFPLIYDRRSVALPGSRVPLIWANLMHNRARTLVGIVGITFAVILIFMQLGFLGSARANATRLYDELGFDLLALSPDYVQFSQPGLFPYARLAQIRADNRVADVCPLYVTFQFWRKDTGEVSEDARIDKRRILVMAFSPHKTVLQMPKVFEQQDRLKVAGTVLFDEKSRPEFHVRDEPADKLPGQVYWLGATPVHVVGQFKLGAGFICDGMVIASDSTYGQLVGPAGLETVNLGLIKLKPGYDAESVARDLNRRLDLDVHVWTRQEVAARERKYWVDTTSIGVIFKSGVGVAILVGIVFVYQVIASDITSRLKEFATLKAIGYSDRYLAWTVLYQAMLLALCGFVPGWVAAFGLYAAAAYFAGIPIGIPGEEATYVAARCFVVLALTVGLCSLSGFFALSKLRAADPADLF